VSEQVQRATKEDTASACGHGSPEGRRQACDAAPQIAGIDHVVVRQAREVKGFHRLYGNSGERVGLAVPTSGGDLGGQ
jgi:hypothetical protein